MKTKNKLLTAIVLCALVLVALPGIAAAQEDETLDIYGNANEDDTIDMRDLTYVKLIFFGKKPETELADAKYDGKINPLDFIQIKLIIVGKEKEITIVDSADRIVTVKKPIERIIVTGTGSAEVLRSIKATDHIVGVSNSIITAETFFYPEFSGYPAVGDVWSSIDVEKVLELQPDVIFFPATIFISKGDELQSTLESIDPDITVIRFDSFKPNSHVQEIEKLGYILEKGDEAEEYLSFYQSTMNTIKERVEGLSEDDKPTVYFEGCRGPYWAAGGAGSGAGGHEMIVRVGGINIFGDTTLGYYEVDPEEVARLNPEIILKLAVYIGGYHLDVDDTAGLKAVRDEIMNRPELSNVRAVKNERVYVVDKVFFSGVSHFIATPYVAKWFHPDLFKDLDPKAIHQEYLTRFQGLDYDLNEHGVFVYPEPS